MMMNKNYWGKENGTQAFHYVLSFPPDLNIDETATYKITEEFCKELLGDSFYYCIAVHNDKDHMHAHVTFDSVSKLDGYKFHSPKGDWEKRIQPITDRICKKYEIPTLSYEKEDAKGMDYGSWEDGKKKKEHTKTGKKKGRNEALERYNSINTLLNNFENAKKKIAGELKIVDGIVGTSIPDYDYRKYKQDRDNHQDDDSSGRRVTINKKLFADNILKEGFRIFRIPGAKDYIAVPIKNTLRLSEITMSAYIYPEKEYDILNLSGDVMRKTIGKDLMKHFDDRTQTHKKKKSFK